MLPVATRFANGPLGAERLGVGIGDRRVLGRGPRLPTGRRLGLGPLRPPAAAAARWRASRSWRSRRTSSRRRLPVFIVVRSRARHRRGALLRRRVRRRQRPRARGAARRGDQRRARCRSTSGWRSGRSSGRRSSRRRGFDGGVDRRRGRSRASRRCWRCSSRRPRRRVLAAARHGRTAAARPIFHPAGILPGFLILTGTWGMAGFLAFVPLCTPPRRAGRGRASRSRCTRSSSSGCGSSSSSCRTRSGRRACPAVRWSSERSGWRSIGLVPGAGRAVHRDGRLRGRASRSCSRP